VPEKVRLKLTVNGMEHDVLVEPRTLLLDLLRDELDLKGAHAGCEHGVCGACTVLVDGHATRSCLMFAAQAAGTEIRTVESLAAADGSLHPLQQAFTQEHGLQCGFCTPGILMAACELLEHNPRPGPDDVREALSGNLCRCTGYQNIINAVCAAGPLLAASRGTPTVPSNVVEQVSP
jgi:aerobic-type carbon monoxide dehydrogenase small subunit (CoxS/CutS family)